MFIINNFSKHFNKNLFRFNSLLFLPQAQFITLTVLILAFVGHLTLNLFPKGLWASPSDYNRLLSTLVWFIYPFLALNLFSPDKQNGTLKRFFSLAYSETQLVAHKMALWLWLFIPLAGSLLFWYVASFKWYYLDGGLFLASVIELAWVSALAFSIALYFSLTKAKTLSVVYSLLLALTFFFIDSLAPSWLQSFVQFFAFNSRLTLLRKGLLHTADLAFFVGLTLLFMNLTLNHLRRIKGLKPNSYSFILVLAILVMQNGLKQGDSAQFDITTNRMHSLGSFTKQLLKEVDSPLIITYYLSPNRINNPTINQNFRLMQQFQNFSNIYVRKELIESANTANGLGLSLQNSGDNILTVTGVFIEYKENAVVIPVLIDHDEVEYRISGKIDQLLHGKRTVTLVTGQNRTADDLYFLQSALSNQFEISSSLNADAIVVFDEGGINRAMARQLIGAASTGQGLLVGLSPYKIPILTNEGPSRIEMGEFQKELYNHGLAFGNQLVFQTEALPMLSKNSGELARGRPYPAWPYAHRAGNDPLAKLVGGLQPLYTSYLTFNNQWQALLVSGQAFLQQGVLDLRPATLDNLTTNDTDQFTFMVKHKEWPIVVAASDSFLSDLVETPTPSNLAYGELLIQSLAGRQGLVDLKLRFWPLSTTKKVFSVQQDSLALQRVLVSYLGFVLLMIGLYFFHKIGYTKL